MNYEDFVWFMLSEEDVREYTRGFDKEPARAPAAPVVLCSYR